MKIRILNNLDNLKTSVAPLFHQFNGQLQPQDAYIEIDPKNHTVEADFNYTINNNVIFAVWHNRIFRIQVSPEVLGSELFRMFSNPEFSVLTERICRGYTEVLNDSNYIGYLNSDAREALIEIEHWSRQMDDAFVYADAEEWVGPLYGYDYYGNFCDIEDAVRIGDGEDLVIMPNSNVDTIVERLRGVLDSQTTVFGLDKFIRRLHKIVCRNSENQKVCEPPSL